MTVSSRDPAKASSVSMLGPPRLKYTFDQIGPDGTRIQRGEVCEMCEACLASLEKLLKALVAANLIVR